LSCFDLMENIAEEYKSFLKCSSYNVVLVGDSRVGKSTFIDLLQNYTSQAEDQPYRGTVMPEVKTLYYNDEQSSNKNICLNILDTPGLDEVTANGDPARPNDELQDIIANHIKSNFADINLILITIQNGGITDKVVKTMYDIKKYFGLKYQNCLGLLITHCEEFDEEGEKIYMESVLKNASVKAFIIALDNRVLFTGKNTNKLNAIQTYNFIKKQQRRKCSFIDMLKKSVKTKLKNENNLERIESIDILESAAATNKIILKMSSINNKIRSNINKIIIELTNLSLEESNIKVRDMVIERVHNTIKTIPIEDSSDQEKADAKHYNEIEIPLKIKAGKLKNINYDLMTQFKQLEDLYNRFLLREKVTPIPESPSIHRTTPTNFDDLMNS